MVRLTEVMETSMRLARAAWLHPFVARAMRTAFLSRAGFSACAGLGICVGLAKDLFNEEARQMSSFSKKKLHTCPF